MIAPGCPRKRLAWTVVSLAGVICAAPHRTPAQALAEAAGANASSATSAMSAPKILPKALPTPPTASGSPSLPISRGPSVDEVNRKALELHAGKDAAKLLLQSVPSEAMITIDGSFVGRTPLLLIVPPGKYKVGMRGQRQESAERQIELRPNETQRVALTLATYYSGGSMAAHPRAATSFVQGATTGTQVFPANVPQAPPAPLPVTTESATFNEAAKLAQARESLYPSSVSAHPKYATSLVEGSQTGTQNFAVPRLQQGATAAATSQTPSMELAASEANRIAFEQTAGKEAAKLELKSIPSGALAYVEGRLVGHTPVQVVLAPGKYRVEMNGEHQAVGESMVGLLPNDKQQLELKLTSDYPANVTVTY